LLAIAVPASAAGPGVVVTTTASPVQVTVNQPIAYVITVTNNTNNTLKYAGISGETSLELDYILSDPASCSQSGPSCVFDNLPSGATARAVFVFEAPATPGTFTFTALSDFDGDTSNPNATHNDTVEALITTTVLAESPDLVRGYSVPGIREFTTGLGNLNRTNQHGTTVSVPVNAEVTLADLPPGNPAVACPAAIAATCFGWGSSLSIANGATISGGIRVTMRWDYTELPNGMTYQKLRVAHLLTATTFEQVTGICTFTAGVPTNMPCFEVAPFKLADRDIQATFWLASNRVSRGY
jgi:hypothetical protein